MPGRQTRSTPAKVHRTPAGKAERTAGPRPDPQADGDSSALETGRASSGKEKGPTERRAWREQQAEAERQGDTSSKARE